MRIQTETVGKYLLIRVLEDLTFRHNPAELKEVFEHQIAKGHYNLAVAFSENSFPTSRLVAVLVTICERVKRNGGELAIVAPSDKMIDTFSILNLAHDEFFTLVESQDELAEAS